MTVVAVDGPVGSGKSTVARLTAERSTWMQRLMDPRNGSNNWVVGGALAGGKALMASTSGRGSRSRNCRA